MHGWLPRDTDAKEEIDKAWRAKQHRFSLEKILQRKLEKGPEYQWSVDGHQASTNSNRSERKLVASSIRWKRKHSYTITGGNQHWRTPYTNLKVVAHSELSSSKNRKYKRGGSQHIPASHLMKIYNSENEPWDICRSENLTWRHRISELTNHLLTHDLRAAPKYERERISKSAQTQQLVVRPARRDDVETVSALQTSKQTARIHFATVECIDVPLCAEQACFSPTRSSTLITKIISAPFYTPVAGFF